MPGIGHEGEASRRDAHNGFDQHEGQADRDAKLQAPGSAEPRSVFSAIILCPVGVHVHILDYKPAGSAKAFNCIGFVTDNKGVDTKSDGQTIAHGLSDTPNIVNVTGTVAGEIVTVTSVDATNIIVAIKQADGTTSGTNQDINWSASLF